MTINKKRPEGGLLQTKEWANVLRSEKKHIIDISSGDQNFFGVMNKLMLVGNYVYFPRIDHMNNEMIKMMTQIDCGWVRLDVDNIQDLDVLYKCGKRIKKSPHNMQPKTNLIINITKNAEELMMQMKSKTRYNIRLAEKKGVKIIMSKKKKYIDAFYDLICATEDRKDVTFHEKAHYEKMIKVLPDDMIKIYIAEYDDDIVAINLVSYCNGVATYLHGATSDMHRNVMAPFLLQWHIIQDAQACGYMWYDLGGIFLDVRDHGKNGITRFKMGFAPHEKVYDTEGSYDIILSPWKYYTYRIIQKLRTKY